MASCPITPLFASICRYSYCEDDPETYDTLISNSPKTPSRLGHGNVCGDLHLLVPGGGVADLLHVSHPLAFSDIENVSSKHLWRLSELLRALVSRGPSQRPTAEKDWVARHDSWKLVDMLLHERAEGREPEPLEGKGFTNDEDRHASQRSSPLDINRGQNSCAVGILRSLPDEEVLKTRKESHLRHIGGSSAHRDMSESDLEYEERLRQISAMEDERLARLVVDRPQSSSHADLVGQNTLQRSMSARLTCQNQSELPNPPVQLSRSRSGTFPTTNKRSNSQHSRALSLDMLKKPGSVKKVKETPPPVPPKDPWYQARGEKRDEHVVSELE